MNDIGFPWDVLGVGAALGGAAGLVVGYQTRKLVVRFQEWRSNRLGKSQKIAMAHDKVVAIKHRHDGELPPTIPIKRSRRSTPQTPQMIPVVRDEPHWSEVKNPDRDDVIAALVNAGYKKADAVKAVDACSLVERASGLEAWTRAAFTNAARKQ